MNNDQITFPFRAAPDQELGLEAIVRMQGVRRWHIVEVTREQTLSEHSSNVAMLAFYIAKTVPGGWFPNPRAIAIRALFHDIEEVFTGDIPSPTKSGIRDTITSLESAVTPAFVKEEIDEVGMAGDHLIKICDLADAFRFIRLHGVGLIGKKASGYMDDKLRHAFSLIKGHWPDTVYDYAHKTITFYAAES